MNYQNEEVIYVNADGDIYEPTPEYEDTYDSERTKFLIKVYGALLFMLILTIVFINYFFLNPRREIIEPVAPRQNNQNNNNAQVNERAPEQVDNQSQQSSSSYKVTDVKLRKVSICTNDLLIEKKEDGSGYQLNHEMLEFVRAIKNKYRVYLMTRIRAQEDGTAEQIKYDQKEYDEIHELLMKLVKQDIIRGKHRLLYSCSEVGQIAQIRHLGADLHLDTKFSIVKNLIQFMNKFHLIGTCQGNDQEKQETQDFVRQNAGKILYFSDINSYTSKIKNALSR